MNDEKLTECCGAPLVSGRETAMCSDCKEHAEISQVEEKLSDIDLYSRAFWGVMAADLPKRLTISEMFAVADQIEDRRFHKFLLICLTQAERCDAIKIVEG